MPNKKSTTPGLVTGVAVMVAVFVITCVIGCTVLLIKRDIIPTYSGTMANPNMELANPATTNCLENHQGDVVTQADSEQNVWSYCALPDGKLCEVWELFRTQTCVGPTTTAIQ